MTMRKILTFFLCLLSVFQASLAAPEFGIRVKQEEFIPSPQQVRRQVIQQPPPPPPPARPIPVAQIEEPNFSVEEEFPYFTVLPSGLRFSCRGRPQGFYADPATRCQVYHQCLDDGRRYTFLCGIGTIFNQKNFICDHWYNYNCDDAERDAVGNIDVFGFHEENPNVLQE